MALYGGSILQSKGGTLNASMVAADLKAGPYAATSVFEIGVFSLSTLAPTMILGRGTVELLQLYPNYLTAYENDAVYSSTALAQAWTVSPVFPTLHLRRNQLNSVVGAGVIWSFPRGLKLASSSSVVIAIPTTGQYQQAGYQISAEVDE